MSTRGATLALVVGLALAALVVFGGGACSGSRAAPAPTLPPPEVNIGPPSPASGPEGYQIQPTSAPVGGPPSGGANAANATNPARDAGVAADPAQDAAPAATKATPPAPELAPAEQPGGLPPTPSVMQNDGGPAAAPILGDAGVPKPPITPLGH